MAEPKHSELIELAAVVRAHGLRGELLLKPFNAESDLLFDVQTVWVRDREGRLEEHQVESAHAHGGSVLFALRAVRDKNSADALRGATICVARDALPPLGEDEHYFVDLVGCVVKDESEREIGRVVEVLDYPSVCCFAVQLAEGRIEVPYIDRYVPKLDAAAKVLHVAHLEELDVLLERASTEGPKKKRSPRPAHERAPDVAAPPDKPKIER
jgi:16S rRNA processing protein RimM